MTDALLRAIEKHHPPTQKELDGEAHVSILDIQRATARHFSITVQRLSADGRSDIIPRAIAMYLSREFTAQSFPVIGKMFRRESSTAIHAFRKIAKLVTENEHIASDIEQIKAAIFGRVA